MTGRRAGELVALEVEILRVMRDALGEDERVHGFQLAQLLRGDAGRSLTAHGTLYKALGRLQAGGSLDAVWEDPEVAQAARRPRRKLYATTAAGLAALAAAESPATSSMRLRPASGAL